MPEKIIEIKELPSENPCCDSCIFQMPRAVIEGKAKWGPWCGLPVYLGDGEPVKCLYENNNKKTMEVEK